MISATEALQHSLKVRQKLANSESIRVSQAIDAAMMKGRTTAEVSDLEESAIPAIRETLESKGYSVQVDDDNMTIAWSNAK